MSGEHPEVCATLLQHMGAEQRRIYQERMDRAAERNKLCKILEDMLSCLDAILAGRSEGMQIEKTGCS